MAHPASAGHGINQQQGSDTIDAIAHHLVHQRIADQERLINALQLPA